MGGTCNHCLVCLSSCSSLISATLRDHAELFSDTDWVKSLSAQKVSISRTVSRWLVQDQYYQSTIWHTVRFNPFIQADICAKFKEILSSCSWRIVIITRCQVCVTWTLISDQLLTWAMIWLSWCLHALRQLIRAEYGATWHILLYLQYIRMETCHLFSAAVAIIVSLLLSSVMTTHAWFYWKRGGESKKLVVAWFTPPRRSIVFFSPTTWLHLASSVFRPPHPPHLHHPTSVDSIRLKPFDVSVSRGPARHHRCLAEVSTFTWLLFHISDDGVLMRGSLLCVQPISKTKACLLFPFERDQRILHRGSPI